MSKTHILIQQFVEEIGDIADDQDLLDTYNRYLKLLHYSVDKRLLRAYYIERLLDI